MWIGVRLQRPTGVSTDRPRSAMMGSLPTRGGSNAAADRSPRIVAEASTETTMNTITALRPSPSTRPKRWNTTCRANHVELVLSPKCPEMRRALPT